jgi:hypothetical protein
MRYPIFRTDKRFFFDHSPPPPHRGWTLKAFQDYCREQMLDAGFDMTRKISCMYDSKSGKVVFWQEATDDSPALTYSLN